MDRAAVSFVVAALLTTISSCKPPPPSVPPEVVAYRNLAYAADDNPRHVLDIYELRSRSDAALPLVVFIHGGGWQTGSKEENVALLFSLVKTGKFVVASINYRLTNQGPHPAQIHDCKGAIRWLRAHASEYGIDADRIAVLGVSAGAHLASLLGTGSDLPELEGSVGGNQDQSSRVACVVNFSGPSNFRTFAGHGSRIDAEADGSAVGKLLGGAVSRNLSMAEAASPINYITKDDAPFLHIHGTADELIPYSQVVEFDSALAAAGIPSIVLTGKGAGHLFDSPELRRAIRDFLVTCLLDEPQRVVEGPVVWK